jgi:hypothetical protein
VSVRDREEMVVARLHALAPQLDGEPDPDFRAATRARLVAMAAVRTPEPEPASALKRLLAGRAQDATRSRWQTRLTAGVAGAALTVTAAAALVAVAAGAQPGDVLYGVKRGTEQTQLALAGDSRGPTLLEFASTRLDELESLVDAPTALPSAGGPGGAGTTVLAAGADPELVLATLSTMDDQTTEGAQWMADRAVSGRDGAPLDELASWAAGQSAGLAALQPLVPDEAEAAVGDSLTLLADVTARSTGLQQAIACPAAPGVQGSDSLGPVPAACPAAPAPPAAGGTGTDAGTGAGSTSVGTEPAVPSGGAGPALPSTGPGSGGSGVVPTAPAVPAVPGVPTPPTPGLPTVSLPLPSVSLPGVTTPSVGVCVGPLAVGSC